MEETKFKNLRDCIYKQLQKPPIISFQNMYYNPTFISIFISDGYICAHNFSEYNNSLHDCWYDKNGKSIIIMDELVDDENEGIYRDYNALIRKCKQKIPDIKAISGFIDDTFIASINSNDKKPKLIILDQNFNILYKIPLIKGGGYGEFDKDIDQIAYKNGLLVVKFGCLGFILSIFDQ